MNGQQEQLDCAMAVGQGSLAGTMALPAVLRGSACIQPGMPGAHGQSEYHNILYSTLCLKL